jgi:hypothetical protein
MRMSAQPHSNSHKALSTATFLLLHEQGHLLGGLRAVVLPCTSEVHLKFTLDVVLEHVMPVAGLGTGTSVRAQRSALLTGDENGALDTGNTAYTQRAQYNVRACKYTAEGSTV